jgi:hypothetical protein
MTPFSITVGGVGTAVGFRNGVEGSMLTYLAYLKTNYASSGVTLSITDDWRVKFSHASSNLGITATTSTALLGFTADITATTTTITAPYSPMYCWFPTHHSYDGSRWWKDQSDRFKGAMGASGGKFGVSLPARYRRSFQYSTNYSANTYEEAEREYYTISATDYYPNAERSFQTLVDGAINAQLEYTGSGNVNPKGVYYIDRAYEYTGDAPTRSLPTTMDAGGIHFDMDTAAKRDNYLFCQFEGSPDAPAMTDKRSAAYYQPNFTLTSDDTPDTVAWVTS